MQNHDEPAYQNLVVRAELSAPVILDHWQPLDGILAAAIIEDPELRERSRAARRYARFRQFADRNGYDHELAIYRARFGADPDPVWGGHFLPLDLWGHGHMHAVWVYASSYAQPDSYELDTVAFTKRVDFQAAADWLPRPTKSQKIQTGKGEFKPLYLEYQLTVTDAITWYVRGIADEIEPALSLIRSIGQKRRRGYGTVRHWSVAAADEDSSVLTAAGQIMRPIPLSLLAKLGYTGDPQTAYTTYRAPYHNPTWATSCAVSGVISKPLSR